MGAALAEARAAVGAGERPHGAAAVLGQALIASGHDEVVEKGDPTAHAVVVTLREAASRLGTRSLSGMTVFAVVEPCAMCVGAMLECDAAALVYALPNPVDGAAGGAVQLAQHPGLGRRLQVVSGIRREEAEELAGLPALAPTGA